MSLAGWIRIALVAMFFLSLELICRLGMVSRFSLIPPSEMAASAWAMMRAGTYGRDITFTLQNVAAAAVLSSVGGFLIGVTVQALPRLRRILEPFFASYYAVPIFVFYPLLIVIMGINAWPLIGIGAMFGVVAMTVSTMAGLDRVPRVLLKSSIVFGMSPLQRMLLIRLPSAAPHLMSGLRLSVVYSVIAVIAGEFILSPRGIGYRIKFAYNDFDNQTMYGLLLLLLVTVATLALTIHHFERGLHAKWTRQ